MGIAPHLINLRSHRRPPISWIGLGVSCTVLFELGYACLWKPPATKIIDVRKLGTLAATAAAFTFYKKSI